MVTAWIRTLIERCGPDADKPWLGRRVLLANALAVLDFFLVLPYIPLYALSWHPLPAFGLVPYLASCLVVCYLTYRGRTLLARHCCIAMPLLYLAIYGNLQTDGSMEIILIVISGRILVIFDFREWRHMLAAGSLIIPTYVAMVMAPWLTLPPPPPEVRKFVETSFFWITAGTILLYLAFMSISTSIAGFVEERALRLKRRQMRRLELLQDVAIVANGASTLDQAMERSLGLVCKATGWPLGHVLYPRRGEGDETKLVSSGIWHSTVGTRYLRFRLAATDASPAPNEMAARAAAERGFAWSDDAFAGVEGLRAEAAGESGLKAACALPVLADGDLVAVLEFLAPEAPPDCDLRTLAHDIGTQLARVEERLRARRQIDAYHVRMLSAARLATLGELAGGIAHEINNPLAIIQAHADRIRQSVGKPGQESRIAVSSSKIEETVARINRIVSGLKSFARESSTEPFTRVKARTVIEEAIELVGERYRRGGVELRIAPIPSIELVARPTQLAQVLVNLLNNSYDAVCGKSKDRWVFLEVEDLGEDVEFAVMDSGPGVPPEIRDRVLQPFFTTKPVGEGTGLGLSISHSIVQAHGGELFLDDEAIFTRFVAKLPKSRLSLAPERETRSSDSQVIGDLVRD